MTSLKVTNIASKLKSYEERTGQTARDAKILSKAFSSSSERQYITDRMGRKVRVFSADNRAQREDVLELLVGKRVVDEEEALSIVGKNVFFYMLNKGYLRKGEGTPFFWVTEKCAKAYKLRPVLGCAFPA